MRNFKEILYVAFIHGGIGLYNRTKTTLLTEVTSSKIYYKDGEPQGVLIVRRFDDTYTNVVCMSTDNIFTIEMWRDIRKQIKSGVPIVISIIDNKELLTRFASLYGGIRVGSTLIFNKD